MWDAAGSPSARTPPGSVPAACQDDATRRPQRQHSVIQGWPFSRLRWQIRPLERGGGQGCPSAPVFVHQLGLISSVLTVVHWFPLHVPHSFQTPLQNSSALSLESSCLWTQAISTHTHTHPPLPLFFPLPCFLLPQLVQTALPQASSKSRPWPAMPGHTQDAAGCPGWLSAPTHHFICLCPLSQLKTSLQNFLCSHQSSRFPQHPHPHSWQRHASPAIFPPDLNCFSLSLLVSINPVTCGWGVSLQSTWSKSLPPPCPRIGLVWLVSRTHGPSEWSGCPGVPSQLQLAEVPHPFGQKKLDFSELCKHIFKSAGLRGQCW